MSGKLERSIALAHRHFQRTHPPRANRPPRANQRCANASASGTRQRSRRRKGSRKACVSPRSTSDAAVLSGRAPRANVAGCRATGAKCALNAAQDERRQEPRRLARPWRFAPWHLPVPARRERRRRCWRRSTVGVHRFGLAGTIRTHLGHNAALLGRSGGGRPFQPGTGPTGPHRIRSSILSPLLNSN